MIQYSVTFVLDEKVSAAASGRRGSRKAHEGIVSSSAMCKFSGCNCRFNSGFRPPQSILHPPLPISHQNMYLQDINVAEFIGGCGSVIYLRWFIMGRVM